MRIYVRLAPLKRPVQLDVPPSTTVAELCSHVGVEALCLAPRGSGRSPSAGAAVGSTPGSAQREQVLDASSAVAAVVPPHATLIAAPRPLPRGRPCDARPEPQRVADRAPAGEWHLVRKPTPCVTAPCGPPPAVRRGRAARPSSGAAKPPEGAEGQVASGGDVRGREPRLQGVETPVLGEDWEELSQVMENEDPSPSERGAESLAGGVMQKLLDWQTIVSQSDMEISCEGSVMSWENLGSSANALGACGEVGARPSLVFAWGDNSRGQCFGGDGDTSVPLQTPASSSCSSCCCGGHSSILLSREGVRWAGGLSSSEQGAKALQPSLEELRLVGIVTAAVGEEQFVAVSRDGSLYAWSVAVAEGDSGPSLRRVELPVPRALSWPSRAPGAAVRVVAVACGDSHSLVLTECGVVLAFGSNASGQLGLGRRRKHASDPTVVAGRARGTPLRAIAAGAKHSLALTTSGTLLAWGSNQRGRLGLGQSKAASAEALHLPELVADLPGCVRHIAAGGAHSAVVLQGGRLLLAGDNSCGQLGRPRSLMVFCHEFVDPFRDECLSSVQSVALGREHTVVLTDAGELCAFGRNTEGQCGCRVDEHGLEKSFLESPVRLRVPPAPGSDAPSVVTGVLAGHGHTLIFCSPAAPDDSKPPSSRGSLLGVRPGLPPVEGKEVEAGGASERPALTPKAPLQPGLPSSLFITLSIEQLASLLAEAPAGAAAEAQQALCAVLAQPSVLNASFCHAGLQSPRLDAAGLCRLLVLACAKLDGLGQRLLDAAAEGLGALADGPVDELVQRDQVRALAVYLCLPPGRALLTANGRPTRAVLGGIAHLVMRMPAAGRKALRDLLADECGDVRVLRDVLLPHAQLLADEVIRSVGQQQWLTGPLWEVVAQLQLQRALWEAVLLLQILASASEEAARLVQPSIATSLPEQAPAASPGNAAGTSSSSSSSSSLATGHRLPRDGNAVGSSTHSEILSFQLASLADGFIPPEVEFWLFQEHAQFRQITPTEVVNGPCWSDAAGMPPRRFCSFMAHANLVPVAFKQRVLQVENVLRQRLSQEQALWPQADMSLGSRGNPSAFYFMLRVSREDLLRETFQQMYSASPVDLRRPLRVEFTGEEAIDEGGVMREFFRLLSRELFAPDAGLFVETEESRRRWFNPVLSPGRQLEDYWMVGIIVALAVYNNHPGLDVPLPTALYKMLKDEPTTHKDLAQLFPTHARSLEAIMEWKPSQPADTEAGADLADTEFMDTFCLSYCLSPPSAPGSAGGGRPREVPLCEGRADKPVRYRDREDFVSKVHDHLLCSSVRPQFESFSRGFRRVCNSPLFSVLSSEELQAIVGGDTDLDFTRLRQGAQYEGYSSGETYIQNLWTVLEGFSMPRRRRFLAFCTGSDVSPAGGLQDLRLLVQRHGEEPTMRLPVAHTCFNLLLLPRYSSVEKLRTMLITAVDWTEGFGLQ